MEYLKKIWPYLAALIIIAGVSLAYFYPDAMEGNVLQQHDMQQGVANSHEIAEYEAATGQTSWWTNSLFGGMPTFQISPSYSSMGLFNWINTVYGLGLPSPANLLAMMMVGMFILLLAMRVKPWMSLIGAVAWGLSSYFVIIIGAGHIWKFLALTYVPPTIAGLVLIYNGRRILGAGTAALFMMLQLASNHVQMTYYFAWVMAGFIIAYGIDAYRKKQLRRWGINSAIFAGAMLLAVAANAPSLYHTYKYSKETMRGGHSELAAASQTPDTNSTSGLNRDYITQYSYEKSETFSLLIPNIKGGTSAKNLADSDKGKALIEANPSLKGDARNFGLSNLPQYFGGEEGTSGPIYVGAIIMALALFGAIVVRGPAKWALVVLTLLSVFLAWGRHMQWFTDLFIDYVPMYSQFRTVESILVIAEFTLPLLAILGLRELFTTPDRKLLLKPLYISFGLGIAVCLLADLAPATFGSDGIWSREREMYQQFIDAQGSYDVSHYLAVFDAAKEARMSMISADAWRSLLYLLVGGGVLWLMIREIINPMGALAIVGVAVLIDLYTADKRYLSSDDFHPAPEATPFIASAADKAILQDSDPDYRVLDATQFMSAVPSYFHKAVGGYHAAKLTRYQDLIDSYLINFASTENAQQILDVREHPEDYIAAGYSAADVDYISSMARVLDMLNTKYVILNHNDKPVVNTHALGHAWFVDGVSYVNGAEEEMAALSVIDPARQAVADEKFRSLLGTPAPASPGNRIELVSYAPDRLEYSASTARGALAVFSEVYFPWGWNVTIDGTPVELGRVNYMLRALPVPAGDHTIVMEFRPQSVTVTNAVAYAAVIAVYLLIIGGLIIYYRKKKEGGK